MESEYKIQQTTTLAKPEPVKLTARIPQAEVGKTHSPMIKEISKFDSQELPVVEEKPAEPDV